MVIPVTKGRYVLVDDEDYDFLMRWRWSAREARNTWYAVRSINRDKRYFFMHREILGAPKGLAVDHINGDGLDNRRENLRLATRSQNCANHRRIPTESGYIGVTRDPTTGKWRARVGGRPERMVGRFASPEEAARARDKVAREVFGEFARLNFPEQS